MQAWQIVNQCDLGESFAFNKTKFIELIRTMSDDEFKAFCKDIINLQHHADSTIGLFATDKPELVNDPRHVLLEIKEWKK